jgi:hypothetical protein
MNIQEQVVDFLEHTGNLSNYWEETSWLCDKVNVILNDDEDDKLGRIRDVFSQVYNELALFVEDNYDTDTTAAYMYDEMVQEELF